jgi:hypothetical protein
MVTLDVSYGGCQFPSFRVDHGTRIAKQTISLWIQELGMLEVTCYKMQHECYAKYDPMT